MGENNFGTWIKGIMVGFLVVVLALILIPMALSTQTTITAQRMIDWATQNGYTLYAAPSGEFTFTGTANTRNLLPVTDSTYNVGTSGKEYSKGYFDQIIIGLLTPASVDGVDLGTTAAELRNIYLGSAGKLFFGTDQSRWVDSTNPPTRAATLVIAASNASAPFKAQADYVCLGADDDVVINAAIAALPAAGGKIILSEGVFTNSGPIKITKPLVIQGQGMSNGNVVEFTNTGITTIMLSALGDNNVDVIRKDPLSWGNNTTSWHTEIRDLCIDGNKAGQTSAGNGITMDYLHNDFHNVKVYNCYSHGFNASANGGADYGKNYIWMQYCQAVRNGGDGFHLDAQGMWLSGCYSGGNVGRGAYFHGGDTWIDMEVESNTGAGIELYQIYESNLKLWAQGNGDIGIYLNNVYDSTLDLYAGSNALVAEPIKAAEIAYYNVRNCKISATAQLYVLAEPGGEGAPHTSRVCHMIGDAFTNNTVWLDAHVNENQPGGVTLYDGLVFADWGTPDCTGSSFRGTINHVDLPVEFQVPGQRGKVSFAIQGYNDTYREMELITAAGWANAITGTGYVGSGVARQFVGTGTTHLSTARLYTALSGFDATVNHANRVDLAKRITLSFGLTTGGSDDDSTRRFQLKQTSNGGALAAPGIGIRLDNLTLVGEDYGGALGETALGSSVGDTSYQVIIYHDPDIRPSDSISTHPMDEWWMSNTTTGIMTYLGAQEDPTKIAVASTGDASMVLSVINTEGEAELQTDCALFLQHPALIVYQR